MLIESMESVGKLNSNIGLNSMMLEHVGPFVLASAEEEQLWAEVQYWTPVAIILGMFFVIFILILVLNIASGIQGDSYID
jgi:hypothetical protein